MITENDPRHGTNRGYNAGCHEPCCQHAHMVYRKRHRMGKTGNYIDPTGTHRRIRALAALGHTFADISRHLDRKPGWAYSVLSYKAVHTNTRDEIGALYERLSMVVPSGWVANRQRAIAARKGWFPPLAWENIDSPTDRPAKRYKPVTKHRPGYVATEHAFLSELGESNEAIATMLGIEPKSLEAALFRADRQAVA